MINCPYKENPKNKLEDIWVLGDHRLICGDSTDQKYYNLLLKDIKYSNENIGNKAEKLLDLSICYLNVGKKTSVKKLIDSAAILIQKMEFKNIRKKLIKAKSIFFEARNSSKLRFSIILQSLYICYNQNKV
jgi:hypothetical protein